MDWRKRKYYCVFFDSESRDMRMRTLKLIEGIRIHPYHKVEKQPDEIENRDNYQFIMSVPFASAEIIEYELRKAERKDDYFFWKEVKQKKSVTKQMTEIAECIVETLKGCDVNDVTDSSGYYIIREFDDDVDRAVDVYKSDENGNPHYVIYCSYENEDFDYLYTDDLSIEQLADKLKEFYFA